MMYNKARYFREHPHLKREYRLSKEIDTMEVPVKKIAEPEPKYRSRGKKSHYHHYYPYTDREKSDLQNEVRDAQYGVLEFHESEHAVDHEF